MALAERGGICGVNFCSFFLEKGSDFSTNEQIVHHMRYIADVAGIDTVAIGSDFDGIECGLEMKDYSGFPGLIAAMKKRIFPRLRSIRYVIRMRSASLRMYCMTKFADFFIILLPPIFII